MKYPKKHLLQIASKIEQNSAIAPKEITELLNFAKKSEDSRFVKILKRSTVPLSLAFGFLYTAFPLEFKSFAASLPSWTNFSPPLLTGVDYLWDLLGEPVRQANILYHIPNIVLYSFGIFGIKKLFDAIDRRTWLDRVMNAQQKLRTTIASGTTYFSLPKGHSILFVGNGDFIGAQFVLNHKVDEAITVSEKKPSYTDIWNFYSADTTYQDLKDVLKKANAVTTGEYIFFPVKDDQIFLPSPTAYDLSPYKLDILCQNIRTIEKDEKWKTKRIIILGDKDHKSLVQSEDKNRVLKDSLDTVSLASISEKYKNVTLIDPTDVVLKKVLNIAKGRKIVFRATKEGIAEYKERFYGRLEELGYSHTSKKQGILTIGYDLFEDQTEQQTLAKTIDDYYPVVLSKNVKDALTRNGYKQHEFLYVPDLVLDELSKMAAEQ